ncbi:MAG: pyrimidine 5'-nucleotidase [Omnitrophica WOR_2 bacterium]
MTMPFTTLFFDLDDTLYPSNSGLWNAIRDRMSRYMVERLSLPQEEVPQIRKAYFETYGTTLRGLQRHHKVDTDEFLAYVHDLPLKEYIKANTDVREVLLSLPQVKWVFTNADDRHAHRVLAELALTEIFTGIIDIRATRFACKPEIAAYENALRIAGETNPKSCVLLDDAPRNLIPAKNMGFFTVLVSKDPPDTSADIGISSILDLPAAFPELWET